MKDKCEIFRSLIPQYAASELDDKTYAKLQRHISKCPHCSSLLDAQLSGKLHILCTASSKGLSKRKKMHRIILALAASLCVILIASAVYLRSIGFVRIASVTVEELSLETVQQEMPELIINTTDEVRSIQVADWPETMFGRNYRGKVIKEIYDTDIELYTGFNRDENNTNIFYKTALQIIQLSWPTDEKPEIENMIKYKYSRYKIFDLIRETRYINYGNERFEKYTATLDLWGTLTRQDLNR